MVIDDNRDKFEKELNSLEGRDYINAISNLMEYCTPKLQRSEVIAEIAIEDIKKVALPDGSTLEI